MPNLFEASAISFPKPSARATERKVVVVAAVLATGSEEAAAHRLGLSHSTDKHHLANARSKVGAETTAQLVWILAPRLPEPEAVVHSQVAMAALIDVRGRRSARNRFDRKIFDFVICSHDADVLYVIELDDRSHLTDAARYRDSVKDDVAAGAGLPLVRYCSVRVPADVLRSDFQRLGGGPVNQITTGEGRVVGEECVSKRS